MKRLRAPALGLLLLLACQKKPSIEFFKADRTSIEAGDVVTLTWRVHDLDQLVLEPGSQLLQGRSAQVTLTETQTLTLVARRRAPFVGALSATASVTITVAPRPIVPAFSAKPSLVLAGAPVLLQWKSKGDSAVIDTDAGTSLGTQAGSGALTVTPGKTTLYTLRAHSASGQQPAPISVRVRVAAPPVVHLNADKTTVTAGEPVTLSWSGTGATGYSLEDGTGFVGTATSRVVRPVATRRYQVTAHGLAFSSATDAVTINVSGPVPGMRALSYTDPVVPADAALALVKDASSGGSLLVLRVVTVRAVAAGGLALDLPIDATRVALDITLPGDASPGFSVSAGALDPGPAPLAARAVLGTGPLANTLVLALAQKANASGVVPDAQLAAGTELCRIRLTPAINAQPGPVLPFAAGAARALLTHLPRDPVAAPTKVAVGTLTLM